MYHFEPKTFSYEILSWVSSMGQSERGIQRLTMALLLQRMEIKDNRRLLYASESDNLVKMIICIYNLDMSFGRILLLFHFPPLL
ncbi:MAG: hypothetical protein A2Z09_04410 [Nitrospirae bacterium RBG_16_43_8]|nr:MAG: hypothetical protein A2Z09_04410 [Nitrospirae bacterium RBG_16_43_8]